MIPDEANTGTKILSGNTRMAFTSTFARRPSRKSLRTKSAPDKKAPYIFANTILDIILKVSAISIVFGGLVVKQFLNQMGFGYLFPTVIGSQGALLAIIFSLGVVVFVVCFTWFFTPWLVLKAKEYGLKEGVSPTLFSHRALIGLLTGTPAVMLALLCYVPAGSATFSVLAVPVMMAIFWIISDTKTRETVTSLFHLDTATRLAFASTGSTQSPSTPSAELISRHLRTWLKLMLFKIKGWTADDKKVVRLVLVLIFLESVANIFSMLPWVFLINVIHRQLEVSADPNYIESIGMLLLSLWILLFGLVSGGITASVNMQMKESGERGLQALVGAIAGLAFVVTLLAPTSIIEAAMYAASIRENPNQAHWYAIDDAAYEKLMPGTNKIPFRRIGDSHSRYICAYSPFLYADKKILCAPSVKHANANQCVVMTEAEARIVAPPTSTVESADEKYCQAHPVLK
jgi:hypothetical protein